MDIFGELYNTMREAGKSVLPPDVGIGRIVSIIPLKVRVGDATITRGLYCPPALLSTTALPTASSTTYAACGSCNDGSCGRYWSADISSILAFLASEIDKQRLHINDLVAIKRVGKQNIILGKLVKV